MKYLIKRMTFGTLVIAILLTSFGAGRPVTGLALVAMAQETDDPVKIEVYTRFVNNRKTNEGAAYQAAKEYLRSIPRTTISTLSICRNGSSSTSEMSANAICRNSSTTQRILPAHTAWASRFWQMNPIISRL